MMTKAELIASVGTEVGKSRWIKVTQEMIDNFAEVTEDRQFIHVNPETAKDTPFGGTIAHGFLTLSLLSTMSSDAIPNLVESTMSVNYGLNKLRFISPVPSGSRIRGGFTLSEISEKESNELTCIWQVTVEIEHKDRPALIAEWITRKYLTE